MQKRNVMMLSLLAALYGGQAIAVEATPAPAAEKTATVAPKKVKKHKKDCVEKDGKPCHLHGTASKKSVKAAIEEIKPPVATTDKGKKAATAAAVVAPVAAAKPEAKAEPAVSEADALAVAKNNNCLACHAIDKKVVGPAWKDVAAKYRGDATAEAKLVSKIATGGKGVWGSMAMPANPQIGEADRKVLAKFVLSLK